MYKKREFRARWAEEEAFIAVDKGKVRESDATAKRCTS
jgi:hypothetical protein